MIRKLNKATSPNMPFSNCNRNFWQKSLYPFILICILTSFFVLLEIKYPFYFLHDDNRVYWLPAFVYNFESILNGEIPIYNFHQFLGYPWLSNGQSMVLYPGGYVATIISKLVFGHYFASIDIFIILHLIAGSYAFYILVKSFGLGNKASIFGAITWVLNSFIIYSNTGWLFLSAHTLYFPLMIYFALKLYKKIELKSFIYLIICRVLLFFVGHPQYFIYSVIFEILTFLLIIAFGEHKNNRDKLIKIIKMYLLSFVITLLLALPLLLPMWYQMSISSIRSSKLDFTDFFSWSYDMKRWINGLVFPFSKSENYGFLYMLKYASYIGYVSIVFIIFCLIKYFKGLLPKNNKNIVFVSIFLSTIAFLWMSSSLFNHLIYLIPILNRFRWPFKIEFYLNFYLIIIASIGLSIFIKKFQLNIHKNIIFIFLITAHIFSFIYLYMYTPQRGFQHFYDKIPLEESLKSKINNGRIVGFNDYYTYNYQETSDFIGSNYATLWGLYHFAGYEPLISENNSKASIGLNEDATMYLYKALWNDGRINTLIDYFRKWGVKWYIINRESILQRDFEFEKFYEDKKRTVYFDNEAKPFVYWMSSQNNDNIKSDIKVNKIELSVNSKSQRYLVINFLYNPFFKASINNKEIEITRNDIGQMMINIPKGNNDIVIKYRDPYFIAGLYISIFTLLVLVIMYFHKKLYLKRLL